MDPRPNMKAKEDGPQSIEQVDSAPPLHYQPPVWSKAPAYYQAREENMKVEEDEYECQSWWSLEVIKNGNVVEEISLPRDKPFLTVGRLPLCDITMEHPSVSRYHAILQFREEGHLFLFDMNSAHGTRLNKKSIEPSRYYELAPGYFLSFGASTRSYVLRGPVLAKLTFAEKQILAQNSTPQPKTQSANAGIHEVTWGMAQEDDSEGEGENGPAMLQSAAIDPQAAFKKDPLKTLRQWCDRHGLEQPEMVVTHEGRGSDCVFRANLELELPDSGRSFMVSGADPQRKQAELLAALQACHYLERFGVLNASAANRRNKRSALREDLDGEVEDYLDRTQTKKHRSLDNVGAKVTAVETYESLLAKKESLEEQARDLQSKLISTHEPDSSIADDNDPDELDTYMTGMMATLDHEEKTRIARELTQLQQELERIEELMNVAKPCLDLGKKKDEQKTGAKVRELDLKSKAFGMKPQQPMPLSDKSQHFLDRKGTPEKGSAQTRTTSIPSSEGSRKMGPTLPPSHPKIKMAANEDSDLEEDEDEASSTHFLEEDVVEWIPPVNQRGDGSTDLNKRLGY